MEDRAPSMRPACNGVMEGGDEVRKFITLVLMLFALAAATGPTAYARPGDDMLIVETLDDPVGGGGYCCCCVCGP